VLKINKIGLIKNQHNLFKKNMENEKQIHKLTELWLILELTTMSQQHEVNNEKYVKRYAN
jgi:hypothetical protein